MAELRKEPGWGLAGALQLLRAGAEAYGFWSLSDEAGKGLGALGRSFGASAEWKAFRFRFDPQHALVLQKGPLHSLWGDFLKICALQHGLSVGFAGVARPTWPRARLALAPGYKSRSMLPSELIDGY